MGGPEIVTHFGRFDVQAHKEGMQSAAGRLPDGDKDAKHLRGLDLAVFLDMSRWF